MGLRGDPGKSRTKINEWVPENSVEPSLPYQSWTAYPHTYVLSNELAV